MNSLKVFKYSLLLLHFIISCRWFRTTANYVYFQGEPNETLTQTVEPHNDFFAAQFLLGFPVPGMYQVCYIFSNNGQINIQILLTSNNYHVYPQKPYCLWLFTQIFGGLP